jgi:hypothetical protein
MVIVLHVGLKHAAQILFVEHDHMIEGVSAHAADDPLAIGICQGLRGAVFTSSMSILLTRHWNESP